MRPTLDRIFMKRECTTFIPTKKQPARCACGRLNNEHQFLGYSQEMENEISKNTKERQRWRPSKHSQTFGTDAHGTIEFQGGSHPIKAKYVRLAHDTTSDKVYDLLTKHWNLKSPKLLMSIQGGKANFPLQPNLKKAILDGLLKAARTTEAWIFTEGTNSGVIKYVGEAFKNERAQTLQRNMATIGIVPWGLLENREDLIGKNRIVPYNSISSPKNKLPRLNDRHAFFLFVDNGTVENSGIEIKFRRKLEKDIRNKVISQYDCENVNSHSKEWCDSLNHHNCSPLPKNRRIPIVGVVIEGGANTIRSVLEYVTDTHPVPVVVCDGSGRAADVLAFTHKYTLDNGVLPASLHEHLRSKIVDTFHLDETDTNRLFKDILQCVQKKELITVFRMGEGLELDQAILTSLLKGAGLNPLEQFMLALTWNRADIASSEIFAYGKEWTNEMLEEAMMEALIVNNVDFIALLLENGAHMCKFLTFDRLESLYNNKRGPSNILDHLIKDIRKHAAQAEYTLVEIGSVVECLMGGTYGSRYRTRKFRERHKEFEDWKKMSMNRILINNRASLPPRNDDNRKDFPYPYNDLFTWAILTKRHETALFMLKRGDEALAKALVAIRLYKQMAKEAEEDDLNADIAESFRKFSRAFEENSLKLLDFCYRQNETMAQKLLTYQLQNWGKQTCLTLAVSANHRDFLAHPCCQILLADLWMGGLRTRKNTNIKVLFTLFVPFFILNLEFKSKKELTSMPQTEEEYNGPNKSTEDDSIMGDSDISHSIDMEKEDSQNESNNQNEKHLDGYSNLNGFSRSVHCLNDAHKEADQKQPLDLKTKIWEFYTAPLTKFLGYSLAYFLYLCIFTYSVLVRMSVVPSWAEIYCLLYIITLTIEKCREIAVSEPVKLLSKIEMWIESNKWNPCDVVAIIIFFTAFCIRMLPDELETSRIVYACDLIYWYLRILHIVSVNKYLGPFVTMIGKMLINMTYFVVFLLIMLMAYGVARQGILHPYEDPSWSLARNIFFKPYFMLYGEVFADTIDPPCGDSPDLVPCRKGRWVAIIVMCLFLLVSNILLINLLIAVFNNIFLRVVGVARQVWKSKRYSVVMEYEHKPVLPPPLIIISHIRMLWIFIFRKNQSRSPSPVLKLFLSDQEVLCLLNFEEQCVDGFLLEEETKLNSSTSELVKANNLKVEYLTQRVNDLYRRSSETVASLRALKYTVRQLSQDTRIMCDHFEIFHSNLYHTSSISEETGSNSDESGEEQSPSGDLQDDHEAAEQDDVSHLSLDRETQDEIHSEFYDGFGTIGSDIPPTLYDTEGLNGASVCLPNDAINVESVALYKKTHGTGLRHRLPSVSAAAKEEWQTSNPTIELQPPSRGNSSLLKKRAARRGSLQTGLGLGFNPALGNFNHLQVNQSVIVPTPDQDSSLMSRCALRRRSSIRMSQRSHTGSTYKAPTSPSTSTLQPPISTSSLLGFETMLDTPRTPTVTRLVHEYTSIMDDIETHQVLLQQMVSPDPNEVAAANPKGAQLNVKRRSIVDQLVGNARPETQQDIIDKEEQLLEAEKQDYLFMAKCAERRLRHDSNNSQSQTPAPEGSSKRLDNAGSTILSPPTKFRELITSNSEESVEESLSIASDSEAQVLHAVSEAEDENTHSEKDDDAK